MKTLLQKCALFCLGLTGILLFSFSCETENKPAGIKLLLTEDTINLAAHPVIASIGDRERDTCYKNVLVKCYKKMPNIIDSIKLIDFQQLKDSAKRIDINYSGHYILGIGIIYGLDPQFNKMSLLYQPVLLKRTTPGTSKTGVEYTANESSLYYRYDPTFTTPFQVVDAPFLNANKKRYKDSITFVTSLSPKTCRNFINSTDSTGDVKGILFAFQEIDSVVIEHKAKKLYILNAATVKRVNHVNYLRHALILGSENLNKIHDQIFYRKYGNLSHLCPPSCSVVKFNLK